MTIKNGGSAYSSAGATGREVGTAAEQKTEPRVAPVGGVRSTEVDGTSDGTVAFTAIDKLKARSMKMMAVGRSKKKRKTLRKPSEAAVSRPQRQVHFRIPERLTAAPPATGEEESSLEFARTDPFRRSSKFRQPLRRVSRAKGSPPPIHFTRIRPIPKEGKLAQPNFDQTSDGESEGEKEEEGKEGKEGKEEDEELPPILLQSLLRNVAENGASDGGSTSSSSDEEETYTTLPATTVGEYSASEEGGEEEEEERHGPADPPLGRRASVARTRTLIRRRSSYRASMRRGSRRRLSSCARRESLARIRRSSIVARTARRKSTAVPGYVVRRRSSTVRPPYDFISSQQRIKRKKQQRQRPRRRRPRKIVVVGEMCSGKSSLISAYCRDKFSDVYVPTILTSCMTDADVLGQKIELVVVEVAGRNDFAKIRNCAYHRMDLAILCYSADNPASLAAIRNQWVPELLQVAPKVPYILVGTKKDIRDEHFCEVELSHRSRRNLAKNSPLAGSQLQKETRENFITTSQGLEAAEAIGARDFIECSAMYREGTRNVFETAAKLALRRSPRRKKKHYQRTAETCTIL